MWGHLERKGRRTSIRENECLLHSKCEDGLQGNLQQALKCSSLVLILTVMGGLGGERRTLPLLQGPLSPGPRAREEGRGLVGWGWGLLGSDST